jgi:hypothetical protein
MAIRSARAFPGPMNIISTMKLGDGYVRIPELLCFLREDIRSSMQSTTLMLDQVADRVVKCIVLAPNHFTHISFLLTTPFHPTCIPSTASVISNNIPRFGLGVYQAANGGETEAAVYAALKAGYRHIDTAEVYRNEEDVGKAIFKYMKETGMSRNELWVTTKYMPRHGSTVPDSVSTKEAVRASITASLSKLGLDYVDLYLIHSPHNVVNRLFEWEAFCELKESGLARSIGVSNYGVSHLSELLAKSPIKSDRAESLYNT